MHRPRLMIPVCCALAWLLATAAPLLAAEPAPPVDPRDQLEKWVTAEKIEFPEAADAFFVQLADAGCKPEAALRWVRMALFADPDWNLAELSGVVEEQRQAGATRQVVEAEIEKRITLHARETRVDLSKFPASLTAGPTAAGGKGKAPAGAANKPEAKPKDKK